MSVNDQDSAQNVTFSGKSPARLALLADLEGGFSETGIRHRRRAHYRRSLSWVVVVRGATVLRRLCDASFAAILLIVLSPLLALVYFLAKLSGGGIIRRPKLGRWATVFTHYQLYFPPSTRLSFLYVFSWLPSLLNILRGDMSFIGPRAASQKEFGSAEPTAWKRYNLRPGLLSLWWLRKRANIAYTSEAGLDAEYVETNSFGGDLGIALRAIPTVFLGGGEVSAPAQIRFLGIQINNLTMSEASARIVEMAQASASSQVCFVNADCVNIAFNNAAYRLTLSRANLVLADGIGVRLAGSILNQNVRENINGTDMLPFLCAAAAEAKQSIYLLGGRPGIAQDAARWMTDHYPNLRIAGTRHGFFSESELAEVSAGIRDSGAKILLVALGTPHQDQWIAKYAGKSGPKVSIGVGGLFDFYSGRIPRAPLWLRELGLEWFYRFWQEPGRMWRRYFLGNAIFLYRVVCERIHIRRTPRTGEVQP